MKKIASIGNKGKGIRSDCFISLEITSSGGLNVELTSKVKLYYGESILKEAKEILNFFDIQNAHLIIEDSGALSYVIAARIEAAIKQLITTDKEYLFDFLPENNYETAKDKHRISRLYLPGNSPSMMINAPIHKPDGIILDLEDAVAPDKKHEARFVVRNSLRSLNFYGAEKMVRINQIPKGIEDLEYVIPHGVNILLVPKCESAEQILLLNEAIMQIQKKHNINRTIWLMPIIESCLGVIKSYEIASSAENIVALAIGLEDYTADLGTVRSAEGTESFFARSMVVNAARATGIQPIDSVFSDVSDMDALLQNVHRSKALGFDGMGCIHPRQIRVIHDGYAPSDSEMDKAKKISLAFAEAQEKGLSVVSLGSKMIDPPVVKRAERTLNLAISAGKLSPNWMKEEQQEQ